MSFKTFQEAVDDYLRAIKKLDVKHAGNLSYADKDEKVIAKKTEKGTGGKLNRLDYKEIDKAARAKKRRQGPKKPRLIR